MVIGSAPGDLHDIGKNIFSSMMEAAGFEVFDLGVDVAPEKFVEKVREVKPNIVGISGITHIIPGYNGRRDQSFEGSRTKR